MQWLHNEDGYPLSGVVAPSSKVFYSGKVFYMRGEIIYDAGEESVLHFWQERELAFPMCEPDRGSQNHKARLGLVFVPGTISGHTHKNC